MLKNTPAKIQNHLIHGWHFLVFTGKALQANKCQQGAAALTYTTLFALVPMMTVSYVILSVMPALQDIGTQIETVIFDSFLPDTGGQIKDHLSQFSEQAKQLTVPGILMLFLTALMMLKTIEATFNDIWGVEKSRRGISSFLLYWGVLSLGPLLAGAGLMLSTYLLSVTVMPDEQALEAVKPLMKWIPFFLTTAALCLIYVAVPNTRVRLGHALIGAFIASLCFELAKTAFTYLVAKSSFAVIYGAFASVPLFLLWIYLCWMIVLFGAVIVRSVGIYQISEGAQYSPLCLALIVLKRFHQAQSQASSLSNQQLVRGDDMNIGALGIEQWQQLKTILEKEHFIHTTAEGEYVLMRDLHNVSLMDLAKLFGARYTSIKKESNPALQQQTWFKHVSHTFSEVEQHSNQAMNKSLADIFNVSHA